MNTTKQSTGLIEKLYLISYLVSAFRKFCLWILGLGLIIWAYSEPKDFIQTISQLLIVALKIVIETLTKVAAGVAQG